MSASRSESSPSNETTASLQPFVLFLVALVAGLLIVIPLLPVWIPNVIYSFSGHAPKVYWYLSRAAGFIALTILWTSMAMGLGITNKMARVWPGAPAAFAIHEYVSLLGLAFAAYHGLVLMGDHFVDFSLPRLLTPFSIAYQTLWVGLGQVGFYAWLIVALSFYARKYIGPKRWRAIHYINFATYLMGLSHGINSGTDSGVPWATWYYWISGLSLLALAAYRIYDAKLKKALARPKQVSQKVVREIPQTLVREIPQTVASRHVPTIPALANKNQEVVLQQQAPAPLQPAVLESELLTKPGIVQTLLNENIVQPIPAEPEPVALLVKAPIIEEPVEEVTLASVQAPLATITAEEIPQAIPFQGVITSPDPMEQFVEQGTGIKQDQPINVTAKQADRETEQDLTPVEMAKTPSPEELLPTPVLRMQIEKIFNSMPIQPPTPAAPATFKVKEPEYEMV